MPKSNDSKKLNESNQSGASTRSARLKTVTRAPKGSPALIGTLLSIALSFQLNFATTASGSEKAKIEETSTEASTKTSTSKAPDLVKKKQKPKKATKAQSLDPDTKEIPQTPSTPPTLGKPMPENPPFRCLRRILYKGKLLGCDSNHLQDGEGLREIIQDIKPAVAELNTYQTNRRSLNKTAYYATAGIALGLGGWFFANSFYPTPEQGQTRNIIRNTAGFVGYGLAASAVGYGFYFMNKNEEHLKNAIILYNDARPNDPLELRISHTFELF